MEASSLATAPTEQPQLARRTVMIGYLASFVGLGLVASSLGPSLPSLAAQTATNLSAISYLFTLRSSGYLLGSFFGGRLFDRFAGNPIIAFSLILMAVLMAIAPFVPVLWLLTILLFFVGIGEGFLDVGGNTLIVWLYRNEVGPFLNALHFCFSLGSFLAPMLISFVILQTGWYAWSYWLIALLMLPIALLIWRRPSPKAPALPDGEEKQPIPLLFVALLALFFLCYVAAEVGFSGWLFTYAITLGFYSEANAGMLVSAFWGSLMLGRLIVAPLMTKVAPQTILMVDVLGAIASLCCALFWPSSLAALWATTIGFGLFMASMFPTALVLAQRRMRVTGKITSIFLVASSLGAMSLPWVIGQLFETSGPSVVIMLVLGVMIFEALVFLGLVTLAKQPSVAQRAN
jgi:FHS family Na+ dependent glucose MFS transporter 1